MTSPQLQMYVQALAITSWLRVIKLISNTDLTCLIRS